jgi:hypothetical protein
MVGEPISQDGDQHKQQAQPIGAGSDQANSNNGTAAHDDKKEPCWRLKRIARLLRTSLAEPNNFPNFLIAIFTLLLSIFAYEAWTEAQRGTQALRDTLKAQISLLDLSTRPIIVSKFSDWQLYPSLKGAVSPTISFPIENVGHSNAQILSATYEYAISPQIPIRFGEIKQIENFPALLPPEAVAPIVISGLPNISATDFRTLDSGSASIWLRTIFTFIDDSAVVYEIRVTGAYSNRPNAKGGRSYGFAFPDNEVPKRLWDDKNLGGLRCLNGIASEPHDFGCGDPK